MADTSNENVFIDGVYNDNNISDSLITHYDETEQQLLDVPVDHSITNGAVVMLMRSYFDFVYAKALLGVKRLARKKHCYGCSIDHPSQTQHDCIMDLEEEGDEEYYIDFYFDTMLKEVNEDDILKSWGDIMKISNISPGVIEIHKMVISSKDFLAIMKTDQWQRKMKRMVLTIMRLEDRLFRI